MDDSKPSDGASDARRLWFRKHAARGVEVRYPPGTTNVGTGENPVMRDNADIAREIADYSETNAKFVLENVSPSDVYEWVVEDPKAQADIAGFLDYPDKLDEKMVEGAGIPKEVMQGTDAPAADPDADDDPDDTPLADDTP